MTFTGRDGDGTSVLDYLRSIFTRLLSLKRKYRYKAVINPSTFFETYYFTGGSIYTKVELPSTCSAAAAMPFSWTCRATPRRPFRRPVSHLGPHLGPHLRPDHSKSRRHEHAGDHYRSRQPTGGATGPESVALGQRPLRRSFRRRLERGAHGQTDLETHQDARDRENLKRLRNHIKTNRDCDIFKETLEEDCDRTPLPTSNYDILQPRGKISALSVQQKRKGHFQGLSMH